MQMDQLPRTYDAARHARDVAAFRAAVASCDLTAQQHAAVMRYANLRKDGQPYKNEHGPARRGIETNAFLREWPTFRAQLVAIEPLDTPEKKALKRMTDRMVRQIRTLDDAIRNGPRTMPVKRLYRGVGRESVKGWQTNATRTFPEYLSTSYMPYRALLYNQCCVLVIVGFGQTRFAFSEYEDEVILPRGSRFRLLKRTTHRLEESNLWKYPSSTPEVPRPTGPVELFFVQLIDPPNIA